MGSYLNRWALRVVIAWRDECGHAAGDAVMPPMGKKFRGVAPGAAVGEVDVACVQAAGQKLDADGLAQIDVALGRGGAIQWGIAAEEALEFVQDLRPDFKSVNPDARTNGGQQALAGLSAAQGGEGCGDHARHDAAPSSMHCRHATPVAAGQQDRRAVGHAHARQAAGIVAEQGVGFLVGGKRLVAANRCHRATMDLVNRAVFHVLAADGRLEEPEISLDALGVVPLRSVLGIAEVERIKGSGAESAQAGAEGVGDARLLQPRRNVIHDAAGPDTSA